MAIDPPYRLDPFRNIINIHWTEEEATTGGTGGVGGEITIVVSLMGSHWSGGYSSNNIYDIYFGYRNPNLSFLTISGMPEYENIANYNLTNPENYASAWSSSATSGLNFAATWESHQNGTNALLETWGPYGIDLSGVTATTQEPDPQDRVTYRADRLTNVYPGYWGGDSSYSGWLNGLLILKA